MNNCTKENIKAIKEICSKNNINLTEQREKVLQIILDNPAPSKAYDILAKLKEAKMQPPVVYRALDFLMQNKLVHKINSLNSYIGCPHPGKHKDCYLFICSKCEGVSECCDSNLSSAINIAAKKIGFDKKEAIIEIRGTCKNCN